MVEKVSLTFANSNGIAFLYCLGIGAQVGGLTIKTNPPTIRGRGGVVFGPPGMNLIKRSNQKCLDLCAEIPGGGRALLSTGAGARFTAVLPSGEA